MQWPFGKAESSEPIEPKVRIARDPNTQEITLTMQNDWDTRLAEVSFQMHAKMSLPDLMELRDQINQILDTEAVQPIEGGQITA
jgi:hypothetical protein